MRPENQLCIPFATTGSDFGSGIIAGFECGLVHGAGPDLLVTTGHTPDRQMLEHFKIVRSHGSATVRNGLVPGHNAVARLETARDAGLTGIWDLSHYHRNVDPVRCARVVAAAALSVRGNERLWMCPVNEPSLYPMLCGMPRHESIEMAITKVRVSRDHHPAIGILTNDPITGIGERQYEATDAIVSAGLRSREQAVSIPVT